MWSVGFEQGRRIKTVDWGWGEKPTHMGIPMDPEKNARATCGAKGRSREVLGHEGPS